jgi:hypothetical protein
MELLCPALRACSLLQYSTVQIKQCPDLLVRSKRWSFKRDLKVAGRDSYCAVPRVITPVRFPWETRAVRGHALGCACW